MIENGNSLLGAARGCLGGWLDDVGNCLAQTSVSNHLLLVFLHVSIALWHKHNTAWNRMAAKRSCDGLYAEAVNIGVSRGARPCREDCERFKKDP